MFWTDYPIEVLGDKPGEQAPVRQVHLLDYDNDKYATVLVGDCLVQQSIKLGYIYTERGRCGQVPSLRHDEARRLLAAG